MSGFCTSVQGLGGGKHRGDGLRAAPHSHTDPASTTPCRSHLHGNPRSHDGGQVAAGHELGDNAELVVVHERLMVLHQVRVLQGCQQPGGGGAWGGGHHWVAVCLSKR